ncbi:transcription factor [Fusarium mundagurra]|uniref:Transcription factor n=1 Tax=Fusarium mundagurra TaxID=1567541 RepID=A0A8H5XV13_9HYPO|nr:transcription factor [Fusarium mundagurra]
MNPGNSDAQQLQESPYHSDASAPKAQRVLACNHCRHRKAKYNRVFPCNNCIKANIVCVPSKPAPTRKRRAPNALLQERIKNLEALLEQYTSQDSPKQAYEANTLTQDVSEASVRTSLAQFNGCGGNQTPTGPGKLVVRNGGYKFLDSYIWGRIYDDVRSPAYLQLENKTLRLTRNLQLQEMRHILDQDSSEDENCHACDSPAPYEDVDLLLAKASSLSLNDYTPLPFQILRLWQVFLERVNPLTKMIHTPTIENLVISAMANHSDIPHKTRALLYAIYLVSVVALSGEEAMTMLGLPKDEAIHKFTKGLKTALNEVNFLRNYDMVVLQSLVLYLIALHRRSNHDAVWVLSGVVIRIAHKMGVHRDGESLGLTPFDTEIRRRVWWRIIILDTMYAATSGIKPILLPSGSDTKIPQNINDADFSPESAVIQNKQGPTEMAFVLVLYEIVHFVKDHPIADFEHLLLGCEDVEPGSPEYLAYRDSLNQLRDLADKFDKRISEVEDQYCDPSGGPMHAFALALRPHILREARSMATPIQETPEWGTEVKNSNDNFFRIWLAHNENEVALYKVSYDGRFLYALKSTFHFDSLLFLAGQLVHRSPLGSLTERTWRLFDLFYQYHEDLWNLSQRGYLQLARLLLKAWEPREKALQQVGTPHDVPDCVPKLQMAVAQAGTPYIGQRDNPVQPLNGGNEGSIGQMQTGEDMPNSMGQGSSMIGDWPMSNGFQALNSETPVLPFFSFFNSTTGW